MSFRESSQVELSLTIPGPPLQGKCCGWSPHGVFAISTAFTIYFSVRSPRDPDHVLRLHQDQRAREIYWQPTLLAATYPASCVLAVRTADTLLLFRISRTGDNNVQTAAPLTLRTEDPGGTVPVQKPIHCACWVDGRAILFGGLCGKVFLFNVRASSFDQSPDIPKNVSVSKVVYSTQSAGQIVTIQSAEDCKTVACGFFNGLISLFHFDGSTLRHLRDVDLVKSFICTLNVSLRPNLVDMDLLVATPFKIISLAIVSETVSFVTTYDSCDPAKSFVPFPRAGKERLDLPVLAVTSQTVHSIFGASSTSLIACPRISCGFKYTGPCKVIDLAFHNSLSVFAFVFQCSKGRVRMNIISAEDDRVSPLLAFVNAYKASEQIDASIPLWILRNTEHALDYFSTEMIFPAFPNPMLRYYHEQRLAEKLEAKQIAWDAIREEYMKLRSHLGIKFFAEQTAHTAPRWKVLLIQLLRLTRTRQLVAELLLGQAIFLLRSWKRKVAPAGFFSDGALQYINLYRQAPPSETWCESKLKSELTQLLEGEWSAEDIGRPIDFCCSVCQGRHGVEMTLSLISVSSVSSGDDDSGPHTSYFGPTSFNTLSFYEEHELLSACKNCGLYSFVSHGTCELCGGLLL